MMDPATRPAVTHPPVTDPSTAQLPAVRPPAALASTDRPPSSDLPAAHPRTRWTAAQRAVAASLLFLLAAVLAGVVPVEQGVEYHLFGIVEGLFALLLAYLLVLRGAWAAPRGVPGWAALVYGTVATAQVMEFLFPPPGLVQWVVVAGVSITAWSVFSAGSPRRLVASLASLAVILALVRYSVIPVLWTRIGPAQGTAFGLGDLAEGARRMFADWRPVRPAGELIGFAAVCCWALATRLVWAAGHGVARGSTGDTDV